MKKTKSVLSIVFSLVFAFSVFVGINLAYNKTTVYAEGQTISYRTVEESALTNLENWANVASTAVTNEFSRELDAKCNVSFQMMWDRNAVYTLVKTDDALVDTWDQIEFAYSNGTANSYYKVVLLPENGVRWEESVGDLTIMTANFVANFDADGYRYILIKAALAPEALETGKTVNINVIYWDFNGSHASVCKYSASASASPSEVFTLIGEPIGKTEQELADEAAAKAVDDLISLIPETVTETDTQVIEAARAAYDALTEAQKLLVSASLHTKLTDAEKALIRLNFKASPMPDWKADLTDLSYWTNVAANASIYEFQRAAGYTDKIEVTFRLIWTYDTIYVLVKAADQTPAEADQIEFAFYNGVEPSYFNTSVGGWQSAAGGVYMRSSQLAAFVGEDGYTYIITKHEFNETNAFETGDEIIINVMYRDFTVEAAQLCIYSASASASPSEKMSLVGTPDVITEEELESIRRIEECADLIIAIPMEITLADEATIVAAKTAYDALSDAEKSEISSRLVDTLLEAVDTVAELKAAQEKAEADAAAAELVIAKIEAIGEVTLDSENAIVEARTAYDALTDDQKALVAEDKIGVLVAAEAALVELKAQPVPSENGCIASVSAGGAFAIIMFAIGVALKKRKE